MAQEKKRKRLQVDSILPNKRSKRTLSTKNHTYESFTNRIARLKIDPIRRAHTRTVADDDIKATTSHFRTAFDNWVELNLSEDFVKFVRAVGPISDSLPQIIHHADDIHNLLLEHIESGSAVSLQPVLDLVSQFAHDLGVKYEKYFPATLQAITKLAATDPDVQVIEWSFTCLAWLFKYLSKLLVPDLRPLYDAMAPLLGKTRQKVFVSRFAAESLSFLMRRSSVTYHTNPIWLQSIIKHIVADLCKSNDSKSIEQYELGLISLFSEAIKGAKETLSSNGSHIFQELLKACLETPLDDYHSSPAFQMLQGVLTALLHDTNEHTFEPVIQTLLETPATIKDEITAEIIQVRLQLVMQAACYKKGDRIKDRGKVLEYLSELVAMTSASIQSSHIAPDLLAAIALCHNLCTVGVSIRYIKLIDTLSEGAWAQHFLAFCDLYSRFGNDRFQTFALPKFQEFVNLHWKAYEDQLIDLIPKLSSRGLRNRAIQLPQAWILALSNRIDTSDSGLKPDDRFVYRHFAITEMLQFTSDIEMITRYNAKLGDVLQSSHLTGQKLVFFLGRLLDHKLSQRSLADASSIWKHICLNCDSLVLRPSFWSATLKFMTANPQALDLAEANISKFVGSIHSALQSPAHDIRMPALSTLAMLQTKKAGSLPEILNVALTIEQTPPSMETFRSMSMHVRKLGLLYASFASDDWVSRAVVSYCFGLLRVKFAPVWEASVSALKELSENKDGAAIIGELVLQWLNEEVEESHANQSEDVANSDFDKTLDVDSLNSDIEELFRDPATPLAKMEFEFEKAHPCIPSITLRDRSQALLLLNAVPQIAEKKSKALVPILLKWVRHESGDDREDLDAEPRQELQKWGRKDLKAMLSVFGSFKNPKSLFKADEVYESILTLLCHGDAEIQRSALQAVFARKNENIIRYQEGLLNLLDDAKFREQFTTFLTIGADEESLRDEYRTDVMPIVLRVLFGRIISRSKGDQQKGNKRAVFSVIARLGQQEANWFVDITLGPLAKLSLVQNGVFMKDQLDADLISQRKQLGLLNMLNDILGFLGATTSLYAHRLIDPIFYCLLRSVQGEVLSREDEIIPEAAPGKALSKSIRSLAMHCLDSLFSVCPDFDWNPYIPMVWSELILPRLEKFHQENAEAVSWLLRMFSIWAKSPKYIHFLTLNGSLLLDHVVRCIGYAFSKEAVKRFVVGDLFLPLLENIEGGDVSTETFEAVLASSPGLLLQLEKALNTECSKDMLENTVKLISKLSELTELSSPELIKTCCSLLRQPSQRVSIKCKQQLLGVLGSALARVDMNEVIFADILDLLCSSFTRGISKEGRSALVDITSRLASFGDEISKAAALVSDLNAFSTSRLDEPDFERRESAFGQISAPNAHFTPQEWSLLLSNALFYITDEDELSIRASASHCVRRFVSVAATSQGDAKAANMRTLRETVFSNIEKGMKDKPELVRAEYLSILAEMVKVLPDWEPTKDLGNLVWYDDEETSFFVNILHIQQHRRLRALGRLQEEVKKGTLSSRIIAHMLVPLLEHFIFDPKGGELAGEASRTVGALAEWMDFPQFKSLFRRYISYLHSKTDLQESILKLLENVAVGFANAHETKLAGSPTSTLAKTLPRSEALSQTVINDFVPPLARFLQEKDESFVSRRVAAVIVAARVLHVLPEREFALKFPPLLTDTCNIMRSRDQNSRDMARKAIASVCNIVGPGAFSFVVKELRRALQRGFFLHVLGFTVHSLLEATLEQYKPGDLDHCVLEIMDVVMDDIFGVTGQEKEAAEFLRDSQSKKEVKSKKSYDTVQILASVTSKSHLIEVVRPIKELLLERLPQKMMHHVDELLRRVEVGISQSKSVADNDILTFCFQVNQDAYRDPWEVAETETRYRGIDAPVPERWKERKKASMVSQREKLGKITRFSLELTRSVFRKHKELKTPANVAGFLPVAKDALLQGNEEIKLAAIRLFAAIVAVPLPHIDEDAPTYIEEAVKIMDSSQTSKDELSQGALKLVATILRERKSVNIHKGTVVSLLKKIKPDLQIISQQGVAFNLIRAIMTRKIIVPEVYELMDGEDGIAAISVRDHDRTTRDLARGVYLQFIMEYPQAQKRFDKQIKFLVRNLEYEYPEGRQSVMEALNVLHNKLGEKLVQEAVKQSFWSVVSVMTNDEIADCRTMAHGLLKTILSRANDSWLETFTATVRKLLGPGSRGVAQQTALQCWTKYLQVAENDTKDVDFVLTVLQTILESPYEEAESVWQLRYHALSTFVEICKILPDKGFAASQSKLWNSTFAHLSFPHAWVKHESAKLVGLLLSDIARIPDSLERLPLTCSHGLKVSTEDICNLAKRHLSAMWEGITQDLASQLIRNLIMFGKCFAASGLSWPEYSHTKMVIAEQPDDSASEHEENPESEEQSALQYLLKRIAAVLRKESRKQRFGEELASRRATALIPRSSALQLIAALATTLPMDQIRPSVPTILVPLVHLTDINVTPPASSDPAFAEAYNTLVTNATELLDILQNKLGTTDFVHELTKVKRAVAEKRDARRMKRRVEVITRPEVVERKKVKKREKEKIRRKEKGEVLRGRRRGW